MKFLSNTKISYLVLVIGLMPCNLISADPQPKTTFKMPATETIKKFHEANAHHHG